MSFQTADPCRTFDNTPKVPYGMTQEQARQMARAEEKLQQTLALPVTAPTPLVIGIRDDGYEYGGAYVVTVDSSDFVLMCLLPKVRDITPLPKPRIERRGYAASTAIKPKKLMYLKPRVWRNGDLWLCRARSGPQITVSAQSEQGALDLWCTCMSGLSGYKPKPPVHRRRSLAEAIGAMEKARKP